MTQREMKEAVDRIDQIDLFRKIIGVQELHPGRSIRSPIRTGDHHPSFNVFYAKNGKLMFKDFAYEAGDIYDLAMRVFHVDFSTAVRMLADMAGIQHALPQDDWRGKIRHMARRVLMEKERRSKAFWEVREWRLHDLNWWKQYGLTALLLRERGVLPVSKFSIERDGEKVFQWIDEYNAGGYVMRIGNGAKLYRPHAAHRERYIGTTTREDIFGLERIQEYKKGRILVICAGQKDAMVFEEWAKIYRFPHVSAISFNSESVIPDNNTILKLSKLCDKMCVVYDADGPGITASLKLLEAYPFITRLDIVKVMGTWVDDGWKDVSDMVFLDLHEELRELFKQLPT